MAMALAPAARTHQPATLAEHIAGWLPVVLLAYPLILWPMLFGVAESARGLMDTPTQVQETNLFNRVFFPLGFLLALTAALVVPIERLRPLRGAALVLLMAYLAWAAASVVWALEPGIALRRLIAQSCLIGALVLSVLAARDPEKLLARLFGLFALAALLNVVAVASGPPGPLGYEGIYTQKNSLGAASAEMVFLAIYALVAGRSGMRLVGLAVLAAALTLLVLSESKTSLGVALLAPLVALGLLVLGRAFRLSAAVVMTAGVALILFVYQLGVASYLWDFGAVANALFGDPTLTSRTDIWGFVMEMISRRPVLGYGFDSFWGIGYEGPAHREAPGFVSQMPHAHNGYLDTLLQTGLVGLVVLLAFLLACLHAASRLRVPPRLSWLALCFIVYSMIHNLLESGWFHSLSFSWILFVILVTLVVRCGREVRPAA